MPVLGSSNSAVNKDMMSKNGQMGIQVSDWVENIVGKREIARYDQFLLFPQCFQKLSGVDASKWVSMEWRVKVLNLSKLQSISKQQIRILHFVYLNG